MWEVKCGGWFGDYIEKILGFPDFPLKVRPLFLLNQ
jgi:hypothetical protein